MVYLRSLIAAVLLCSATTCCDATKVTGSVVVGGAAEEERRAFLGKFSFGLGAGLWDFRAKLKNGDAVRNATTARLELVMDEKWVEVRGEPKCSWKPKDVRDMTLSTKRRHYEKGTITHRVRS